MIFFLFSLLLASIYSYSEEFSYQILSMKKGFNSKVILPYKCAYFINDIAKSKYYSSLPKPDFCQIFQKSIDFEEFISYKEPFMNRTFQVSSTDQVLTYQNSIFYVENSSYINQISLEKVQESDPNRPNSTISTSKLIPRRIINQESSRNATIRSLHVHNETKQIVSCSYPAISIIKIESVSMIYYKNFSSTVPGELLGCHLHKNWLFMLFNSSHENNSNVSCSLLKFLIQEIDFKLEKIVENPIPDSISLFSFNQEYLYVKTSNSNDVLIQYNLIDEIIKSKINLALGSSKTLISKGANNFYTISKNSRELKEILIKDNTTIVNLIMMISDIKLISIGEESIYVLQENLISTFPRNITMPSEATNKLKSSVTLEGVDMISLGFNDSVIAFKKTNISVINLISNLPILQCKPSINESLSQYALSLKIFESNSCLEEIDRNESWKSRNLEIKLALYVEFFESSNIALGIGLGIGLSISFIISIIFCVCYFKMKGRYRSLSDNVSDNESERENEMVVDPGLKDEEAQKLQIATE